MKIIYKKNICKTAISVLLVVAAFSCNLSVGWRGKPAKNVQKWQPSGEFARLIDFDKQYSGFKKSYGPNFYNKKTIFDFIDGGADAYLNLGCIEVMNFELAKTDDPKVKVVVDIYNMDKAGNAFAIFEKEKTGNPVKSPHGSLGSLSMNMLQFVYDKYYSKVAAYSDIDPKTLESVAWALETRMFGTK